MLYIVITIKSNIVTSFSILMHAVSSFSFGIAWVLNIHIMPYRFINLSIAI